MIQNMSKPRSASMDTIRPLDVAEALRVALAFSRPGFPDARTSRFD